jgi:hypothetical protein
MTEQKNTERRKKIEANKSHPHFKTLHISALLNDSASEVTFAR